MPLTLNDPSPCGRGIIKYVCREIAADLEKVSRAVESKQRHSAVQQLDNCMSSKGKKAPFLALKVRLELELGKISEAKKTSAEFVERFPDYSSAWTYAALLSVADNEFLSATTQLQKALEIEMGQMKEYVEKKEAEIEAAQKEAAEKEPAQEKTTEQEAGDKTVQGAAQTAKNKKNDEKAYQFPELVYMALGIVAQGLTVRGKILAARAHLKLQTRLAGEEDSRPGEMLATILGSEQVSLLLKEEQGMFMFDPRPGKSGLDKAQQVDFTAAVSQANSGLWLKALETFQSLAKKCPQHLSVRWNMAVLFGCLGDDKQAAAAWRLVSLLPDVPEDESVQAEAVAQVLEPDKTMLAKVCLTHAITDHGQALERLQANPLADSMQVDLNSLKKDDAPPPKAAFWLLDQPIPESAEDVTLKEIPNITAEILLFGKTTDRAARLETTLVRTEESGRSFESLQEILGDCLEGLEQEETVGEVSQVDQIFSFRWRTPRGLTPKRQSELVRQRRRHDLLERWTALPLTRLEGKTPAQAQSEPKYRTALLAAVQVLEVTGWQQRWQFDFNELRTHLNLPPVEPIDPRRKNVPSIPLTLYGHLVTDKLADEALTHCYQQALVHGINLVTQRMAREVIRRDSLNGLVSKAGAFAVLAGQTADPLQQLDLIQHAQAAAVREQQSPAQFLIAEMGLRARRGEMEPWLNLAMRLQEDHLDEPKVAQTLAMELVQSGVITSEGQPGPLSQVRGGPIPLRHFKPVVEKIRAQSAAGSQNSPAIDPTQESTKIVTSTESSKSKLWLPGS